jgi:hypothetical protein
MGTTATAAIIFASLCTAVGLGTAIRRRLPDHHRGEQTKDAVKLAMGLVATMSALLLGLLVSSAKDSYDTVRSEVIQMAAKLQFLDRVLALYGPEAAPLRTSFHAAVAGLPQQIWAVQSPSDIDIRTGDAVFAALQALSPGDEAQRVLKGQAELLAVELVQLRTLIDVQSLPSISQTMLVVVALWLVVLFFFFSLFAPPNATALLALLVSALSVAGAIFLILELDRPFTGLIRLPIEPLAESLSRLGH